MQEGCEYIKQQKGLVRGLNQQCQGQDGARGHQDDVEGDMWARVAFILVAAANLASHVVILSTVDYRQIAVHLVTTAVLYHGRAIFLDKAPRTSGILRMALDQMRVFVVFQKTLFTVIFSAYAIITLQCRH